MSHLNAIALTIALLLPTLQRSGDELRILAAIRRCASASGYEITNRRFGVDEIVRELEDRDARSYQPATRILVKLRSLRPWPKSQSIYFRYWLFRETYQTESQAEKRVAEYMTDYQKRLATSEMSEHMISKTSIRVGAARRGPAVFLLVTDGAYTTFDDKKRDGLLRALTAGH